MSRKLPRQTTQQTNQPTNQSLPLYCCFFLYNCLDVIYTLITIFKIDNIHRLHCLFSVRSVHHRTQFSIIYLLPHSQIHNIRTIFTFIIFHSSSILRCQHFPFIVIAFVKLYHNTNNMTIKY